MKNSHKTNGFTLIELLIAIAIFSVMAAMAYGGVRLVMDGDQQIEQAADSLSSLQRAFLFIQQDIEQSVPRGVRDEFGTQQAAFICCTDEKPLQLTRSGTRGSLTGRSNLRRVEYHLSEGRLQRKVWSTLDRVHDDKPSTLRLMENVVNIEVTVLGYSDSIWQGSMPAELESDLSALPRAIEVTIKTERYGAVSRLFVIGS